MSETKAHAIVDDGRHLAYVLPASRKMTQMVLAAPEGDDNGRSEFVWLRLADGTLMLGVFPQGDTYIEASDLEAQPAEEKFCLEHEGGRV